MNRERTLLVSLLCLWVVLLAFVPQPAWGQQVTAAITGTVTDPSGAPIANAMVTAKDTARGTAWMTTTNSDGVYNLPRVPTGNYEVRVESKGFQTAFRPAFTLELNQTARVDFQMKLGQVTETVEVNSEAPLLQTDSTQLNTVINSTTNVALPLATRNYVQLTLLAPGSVHPDPETMTTPTDNFGAGRPYINGNREQANNFMLDGLDNNQVSDNLVGYTPSVDAIQEFNMITNNASAEFGNFQGGIISTQIKSGTNQYHGDLFEFFRNDKLNANNWANNWSDAPRAKLRWNMYGATLGGPVKKDRLFFFVDYQGQRFDRPSTTSAITVYTAAERQGDFSQLLQQKGIQLYNPFDIVNGQRQPFPNNQIPMSLLDPVAANVFASPLYPQAVNGNLTNNAFNTSQSAINVNQGDAKVDWNISDKDRFFGRYSQSFLDSPTTNSQPLDFNSFDFAPIHSGVLDWTRTFSPTFVNEVRAGVNYILTNSGTSPSTLGNVAENLGIANGNARGPGLLNLAISGGVVGGIGNSDIYQLFPSTVIQAEDTVVITKGRHIIHTGFQVFRERIDPFYGGNNGLWGFMNFTGRFTAGPNPLATAGSGAGAGEADFFLGLPDSFGRGVGNTGTWGQRSTVYGAYVQDDFRVSNSLTLNLGLRYETHTPWVEVDNRQSNFDPFTGAVQLAGQSNIYGNNGLYHSYNGILDFQPRVGFAWTPKAMGGKTVVRAAYTLSSYLEGTGTNLRLPMNPPFRIPEFQTNYYTTPLPATRTEDGLLAPTGSVYQSAIIRLWDPNVKPAGVQQWNFTLQQQFSNTLTLQAGYVGQHGTHLAVPMPYLQEQLHPDGTITPSPYLAGNPTLQSEISQISGTASIGSQKYDALQVVLEKRFSDGVQAQVAYTYSKCMTNSIGYYGAGGQAAPTSAYWQNLYDGKAEWGPCFFDVTHVLTSYAVYELPFGKGRKFANNMNAAANAVLGNWNVSGILSLHGGFPLTISAGDVSGTNSRGARADCIAPAQVFGEVPASTGGYQWFDPNSYAAPTPGTFGSCGVGTVRGPGLTTFDLSLQKQFAFTESKRLELRGEAINLTNTPILNSPGTGLGGGLGQITSSQGERNIQFALKFYF
jgi:Carboxypeptidase regulatory-like domain/TonB dependent receptor